jgi:DNA-binding GntR family transcriptional regulator
MENTSATLTEQAVERLASAVLSGELAPGEKLRIGALVQRYELGPTPIREALSRMTTQGLVVAKGGTGFRVTEMSLDDLIDIARIRTVIETEALKLSIANGRDHWEGDVASSLHRLALVAHRFAGDAGETMESFEAVHKDFHIALISACGSPRMLSACSVYSDQSFRYRRRFRTMTSRSPEAFVQEHKELAEAVLSRDHHVACEKLVAHLDMPVQRMIVALAKEQKARSAK